jgi:molecular chaperone DnaK (HSP70)
VLEPVAVAAAYGLFAQALTPEQPILVVDLGARSCEAAVLRRDERVMRFAVVASAGNTVGSEECDTRIVGHLAHLYERELGLSPHGSRKAMARLRLAAEWAKRSLSINDATTVRLPSLLTVGHTPFDLTAELSREQLELLVEDEVRRSLQAVEIVLREARLLPSQLHAVLMSGGGAEMPLFARVLEELVVLRPLGGVRPEEAIARGAARLGAARLNDDASRPSAEPIAPPAPAEPRPQAMTPEPLPLSSATTPVLAPPPESTTTTTPESPPPPPAKDPAS